MRAISHPESPASRRQKTGVRPILNAHWHEQQPFNLPNPESVGKIISGSSLLGNSHCLERSCNRAGQSPIKFSYQQNFPTQNSEARDRGLPPVQLPPPGTARLSSTVFRLIKPPIEGRKIVWVGIFPKPPAGGTRIRQSFRLKAGLRTRKSRLVSLRKIFLPTKFSCQKFRGSAPMASTHPIPTARQGPAQLNHFPD